MKMYKFFYNQWSKEIETTEFEVEEKEKTYKVSNPTRDIWQSRIRKDDIGKLYGSNNCMFSLSPDPSEYISRLIELEGRKIKSLEHSMKYHGEILKNLRELSSMGEK